MVRLRLPVFLILLALVLAACASPAATPTAVPPTATTVPVATATTPAAAGTPAASGSPAASASTTLKMADDPKLGSILTDANGMTLYYYKNDQSGTSTCTAACATSWPPLLVTSGQPAWPAGLPGTLATITRADGGTQVTYNGMPLYTFASDTKAGDTTGEGKGNVWHVAKPGEIFIPEGQTAIKVTTDAKLGPVLTDSNGWTLYYYTKDAANATNCTGNCAKTWPPFVVALGSTALPTGTAGTLGTVTRADGTTQVTYNGMPLYYWVKDLKPGDTTGQNVGKVWFVVAPGTTAPANFGAAAASTTPAPAAATPAPAGTGTATSSY